MSDICISFVLFLLNFVYNYPGKCVMMKTLKIHMRLFDVVLVSLLLTLNILHTFYSVSNVDFEQGFIYWVLTHFTSLFLFQTRDEQLTQPEFT